MRSRPLTSGLRLLAPLVLLGCGTEVGRVACEPGQTQAAEIAVETDEPAVFWTDLDVEYDGNPRLSYTVVVEADGERIAERTCDPLDVNTRVSSYTSDVGRHHVRRYQGKMKCEPFEVSSASSSPVRVQSTLSIDGEAVAVNGCDLVIKQ